MQAATPPAEDLEQQLKAWRRSFEARKAVRLGTTAPAPSQASTLSPSPTRAAAPGPCRPSPSPPDSEGRGQLHAPRLGSGEAFRKACSPSLDLHTPISPVSGARAWMLNASLTEPGGGASSPLAAPVLQEPTPSQRPLPASPKKNQGANAESESGQLARPPAGWELGRSTAQQRTSPDNAFCLPPPSASPALAPPVQASKAPSPAPSEPLSQQLRSKPQPPKDWEAPPKAREEPGPPKAKAWEAVQALAAAPVPPLPVPRRPPTTYPGGTAAALPDRVAAESAAEDLQVRKRLREVQKQIAEYDQELDSLAKQEEEESDEGLAKLWESLGTDQMIPTEQLEQELAAVDKRVASLEDQLNRVRAGGALGDEAPSDASTSATPWGASLEDGAWQQKAEVLRDEVLKQSALATEIQDRIYWLRAQLRRQPGLHDRRVQELVVLLAEMAETEPRNQRVAAIRELLAEIAEQAAATEVV